jgi:ankyrin repeat protein
VNYKKVLPILLVVVLGAYYLSRSPKTLSDETLIEERNVISKVSQKTQNKLQQITISKSETLQQDDSSLDEEEQDLSKFSNSELIFNKHPQEFFKRIKSLGIDLNKENEMGQTLLMDAVNGDCLECLQALIERGVIIDKKTKRGETALLYAVGGGDIEFVRLLLTAGANPNIVANKANYTMLMDASFQGHLEVVNLLIEAKAAINEVDNEGKTALTYAAREGFISVVKTLVDAGADIHIKDTKQRSALDYARKYQHSDLVSYLESL